MHGLDGKGGVSMANMDEGNNMEDESTHFGETTGGVSSGSG